MKLSEAIRLGAMLRPQGFRRFFSPKGSCAMGAAIEALGLDLDATNVGLSEAYPWLFQAVGCPCGRADHAAKSMYRTRKGKVGGVCVVIAYLNDFDRWTREQIADWVASIEPDEVPQTEPVEEDACVGSLR